jgi:methyl-accepting chemotaxis protein
MMCRFAMAGRERKNIMKRTDTISFKTVLLITVPLTVVLVVTGFIINIQIRGLFDEIVAKDLATVSARSEQIGAIMNEISDYPRSLRAIKRLREGTSADRLEAMANIKQWMPKRISDLMYIAPDGAFLNSDGKTGSLADREYFKYMLSSGADYTISPPVISKVDGSRLFTVIARLTDDKGELTGFVSCAIQLETLSAICRDISFGKTGYGWMIDSTGMVIAHPDDKMVFSLKLGTADAEKGFKGLAALNDRMQKIPVGGKPGYAFFYKPNGKLMICFFARIPNSPGWLLGMNMDNEEYFGKQEALLGGLIALFLACIAIVIILSFIVARNISKPIKVAQKAFEQLAAGDADLTKKIDFTAKNEVGALVDSFNAFLDKLRDIVVNLKDEQHRLEGIASELKANTRDTTATVTEMTGTINEVVRQTSEQNALTNDSSAGVNEIAANIESLDNLIASQASSITEASSAIEQMVHNIASISASMGKMSDAFEGVAAASGTGKEKITAMTGRIEKIVERSTTLLEVNKTIAKIAAQTNLLAMNAAIESAHAGEAGKGFAVVADEIRRLAEDSSAQSKIINKELAEVQKAILEVAGASKESEVAFTGMEEKIGDTENLLREINRALQEQTEGSKQVLIALKEMNDISSEVRNGAGEMRAGNTAILEAMNGLKTITGEIGAGMNRLSEKSGDIAQKAENLAKIAEGTAMSVEGMEDSIGKFTV